jgi:hypothetical protein
MRSAARRAEGDWEKAAPCFRYAQLKPLQPPAENRWIWFPWNSSVFTESKAPTALSTPSTNLETDGTSRRPRTIPVPWCPAAPEPEDADSWNAAGNCAFHSSSGIGTLKERNFPSIWERKLFSRSSAPNCDRPPSIWARAFWAPASSISPTNFHTDCHRPQTSNWTSESATHSRGAPAAKSFGAFPGNPIQSWVSLLRDLDGEVERDGFALADVAAP